jgi:hypothetical protein
VSTFAGPQSGFAPPVSGAAVPQPGYAPPSPNFAAPSSGFAAPETQPGHAGGGYGAPPPTGSPPRPARRGRALPILLAVLGVVLVLFVGAGVVAYRTFFDGVKTPTDSTAGTPTTPPAAQPSAQATGAGTAEEVTGDLSRYKVGDCLTVDDATNNVEPATCADAGAYKVLLRKDGTIDDSVCQRTDATMSLYEDADGTTRDFVLCVGPAA